MEELRLTLADIKALGDKLDSLDLGPAEKALLSAAMDVTARMIDEGGEVEGFGFSSANMRLQAPAANIGMGRIFETSFSRVVGTPNIVSGNFTMSLPSST